MTRHCQMTIAAAYNRDTICSLDNYCLSKIKFWLENLHRVNTKKCFNTVAHNKIIYSDASSYACEAVIKEGNQRVCHKMFSHEGMQLHRR